MKKQMRLLFALIALHPPAMAGGSAGLPDRLLIIGFDGENWYPYLSQPLENSWRKITAIHNPVSVTQQTGSGRFLFKGSDGRLYEYMDGDTAPKLLQDFDSASFTQLRAFEDGFLMVELVDGKSSDARLVTLGNDYSRTPLLRQDSAQFHPLRRGNRLYYSHVSCRLECEPLIQEIWVKNLVTGHARQLTLLNATSYLHSLDRSGRYGYISSNANGYYNLARLDLSTGEVVWLTSGRLTDSYPAVADDGALYFLRRTPKGTRLMRLAHPQGRSEIPLDDVEAVPLPEEIQKVRYLEISR